jgi:hypothetical protein
MRHFSVTIICIGILSAGCSRSSEEYRNGRATARADANKGILAIAYAESAQLPACWFYYEELLRTNYGVQRYVHSLPVNPQAAEAWSRGYNEVAQPEIERRLGTNVLKSTMAEAQKIYEALYKQKRKPNDL